MRATISRSPGLALVMEYNPQALSTFGHDPVQVVSEVMAMGFAKMQVIETDGSLSDIVLNGETLPRLTARLMAKMDVVNLLLTR